MLEWHGDGFALAERFGRKADTDLIESGRLEVGQGLAGEGFGDEEVGVARSAEWKVWSAVGVLKVVFVGRADWAAIPCLGGRAGEGAGLAGEFLCAAEGFKGPFARGVGRETRFVDAVSIVEA